MRDWLADSGRQDGCLPLRSERALGEKVKDLEEFYHVYPEGRISPGFEDVTRALCADLVGIGMVHQHLALVPTFTVVENLMLGAEGRVDAARGRRRGAGAQVPRPNSRVSSASTGLAVDPDALVSDPPVGLQQRVEILKALEQGARILILDEPTGVLTPGETDRLFAEGAWRALREVTSVVERGEGSSRSVRLAALGQCEFARIGAGQGACFGVSFSLLRERGGMLT